MPCATHRRASSRSGWSRTLAPEDHSELGPPRCEMKLCSFVVAVRSVHIGDERLLVLKELAPGRISRERGLAVLVVPLRSGVVAVEELTCSRRTRRSGDEPRHPSIEPSGLNAVSFFASVSEPRPRASSGGAEMPAFLEHVQVVVEACTRRRGTGSAHWSPSSSLVYRRAGFGTMVVMSMLSACRNGVRST